MSWTCSKLAGKDHHIVPVLDTFEDDREPDQIFFVMPMLRQFDSPEFEAVSEIVDLFKQVLEVRVDYVPSTIDLLAKG